MAETPRTEKFINYVKEAFYTPFHLASMGVITATSFLATILASDGSLAFSPAVFLLLGVGAEMTLLGALSRNPRFIRAINARHKDKIDEYYKTRALVDHYNLLSINAQQRFDKMQKTIKEVRERYKKVGSNSPTLVDGFLTKLNQIEMSFVRLLYYKDKFLPELSNGQTLADETVNEIDMLNQEIKVSTGKLKEVKMKRLKLLEMKMENFLKIRENKEIIEERLQTMEDMVEYFKDQPMTMLQSDKDDVMMDNILFDAEQTQESLAEIESMMQSEFSYGTDDFSSPNYRNERTRE